mmetsp:Transcript_9833/g.24521  ORF Transcript_9833/g.24521 Transcript_9833/m.24521 type:complete len:328 (+) Transcript_9833:576-1559(+)
MRARYPLGTLTRRVRSVVSSRAAPSSAGSGGGEGGRGEGGGEGRSRPCSAGAAGGQGGRRAACHELIRSGSRGPPPGHPAGAPVEGLASRSPRSDGRSSEESANAGVAETWVRVTPGAPPPLVRMPGVVHTPLSGVTGSTPSHAALSVDQGRPVVPGQEAEPNALAPGSPDAASVLPRPLLAVAGLPPPRASCSGSSSPSCVSRLAPRGGRCSSVVRAVMRSGTTPATRPYRVMLTRSRNTARHTTPDPEHPHLVTATPSGASVLPATSVLVARISSNRRHHGMLCRVASTSSTSVPLLSGTAESPPTTGAQVASVRREEPDSTSWP